MTLARPLVLCLDLGGVVVRICRSWGEACERAGVALPTGDPATMAVRSHTIASLETSLQRGELSFDEFAASLAALLGTVSAAEVARVHDAVIVGDYPGMRELLTRVAESGIRVACLSNTNARHWEQMRTTSEAFRAIAHPHASHTMRLCKPDPRIYEAFERAMSCAAPEILFVDDLHENVAAARARGWRATRIDPSGDTAAQVARALEEFALPDPRKLPSPLCVRTLTGARTPGGLVKARASDFLVDEIPSVEPCGEGEHLLVGVHKVDITHEEMLRVVAAHFRVETSAIGFAGIKDRRAETRQTLSVHVPHGAPLTTLTHPAVALIWTRWHSKKLRKGQLGGNRFSIRVREVDLASAPVVRTRLAALEQSGVPNAFGVQRFGSRRNNHRLGLLALQERWSELVAELTGTSNLPFPPHQRDAREACDCGRWSESLPLWGSSDDTERLVALGLSRGWKPARAVKSLGGDRIRFWISALQSAIFNRTLDERIASGEFASTLDGDVLLDETTKRCTLVAADGVHEAARAVARHERSVSGPLPGTKLLAAGGSAGSAEARAMAAFGAPLEVFTAAPFPPAGARRPLRVLLSNPSLEAGADEHGPYIKVAFDLPPGAFATTVLRELFGELRSGEERSDEDHESESSSSSSPDGSMSGGAIP